MPRVDARQTKLTSKGSWDDLRKNRPPFEALYGTLMRQIEGHECREFLHCPMLFTDLYNRKMQFDLKMSLLPHNRAVVECRRWALMEVVMLLDTLKDAQQKPVLERN